LPNFSVKDAEALAQALTATKQYLCEAVSADGGRRITGPDTLVTRYAGQTFVCVHFVQNLPLYNKKDGKYYNHELNVTDRDAVIMKPVPRDEIKEAILNFEGRGSSVVIYLTKMWDNEWHKLEHCDIQRPNITIEQVPSFRTRHLTNQGSHSALYAKDRANFVIKTENHSRTAGESVIHEWHVNRNVLASACSYFYQRFSNVAKLPDVNFSFAFFPPEYQTDLSHSTSIQEKTAMANSTTNHSNSSLHQWQKPGYIAFTACSTMT
jgi:hypothetical protein